jgi:hypothetical protein
VTLQRETLHIDAASEPTRRPVPLQNSSHARELRLGPMRLVAAGSRSVSFRLLYLMVIRVSAGRYCRAAARRPGTPRSWGSVMRSRCSGVKSPGPKPTGLTGRSWRHWPGYCQPCTPTGSLHRARCWLAPPPGRAQVDASEPARTSENQPGDPRPGAVAGAGESRVGYRRVHRELNRPGHRISETTVRRILRARRRRPPRAASGSSKPPARTFPISARSITTGSGISRAARLAG